MLTTWPSPLFPLTMAVTTTSWSLKTKLRIHRSFFPLTAERSNFRAEVSWTNRRKRRPRKDLIVRRVAAIVNGSCGSGRGGGDYKLTTRLGSCCAAAIDATPRSGDQGIPIGRSNVSPDIGPHAGSIHYTSYSHWRWHYYSNHYSKEMYYLMESFKLFLSTT